MVEAFGKYAEAKASNEDADHLRIIDFLKSGEMVPLEKLISMNVGSDPYTYIAYPAAGSFIDYLIATNGLGKVKQAYQMGGQSNKAGDEIWVNVFQYSLESLEKSWLMWLAENFDQDIKIVEVYFEKLL